MQFKKKLFSCKVVKEIKQWTNMHTVQPQAVALDTVYLHVLHTRTYVCKQGNRAKLASVVRVSADVTYA